MNDISARFNSARCYCVQRIRAIPHGYVPQDTFTRFALDSLLNEIESFVAEDFTSVSELIAMLTLAAEQAQARLTAPTYAEHAALAVDLFQGFIRLLHAPPDTQTPVVPYRRVLTKAEAKRIWRDFDHERWLLPKGMFTDDKLDLTLYQAILVNQGITTLFNISPASHVGYKLDTAWLGEMYSGDDTYWTSKEFTWYIYADGSGYPMVAGELLRETEGDKAFSAYLVRQSDMLTAAASQKLGQPAAAAAWTALRERYTEDTTFLYDRVDAELRLRDLAEAERVAEQLRATPGGEGLGLYQLSVVREAQGRIREAIAFAEQSGQVGEKENRGQLVMAVRTRMATLTQLGQ